MENTYEDEHKNLMLDNAFMAEETKLARFDDDDIVQESKLLLDKESTFLASTDDEYNLILDAPEANAFLPVFFPASEADCTEQQGEVTKKQMAFLAHQRSLPAHEALPTPFVLTDLDVVRANYESMVTLLPRVKVHYAVKASPADEILSLLQSLGSRFDCASRGEIDQCMRLGAPAEHLSFGNTIKKEKDIVYAFARGVKLFAYDSIQELEKIARAAPGAEVYARILVDTPGAEWPLSRKFGCAPEMAEQLMLQAKDLGLKPVGVSFHVGSQQTNLSSWFTALEIVSKMFANVKKHGVHCTLVNLGGGFPARYQAKVHTQETYANTVNAALQRYFGAELDNMDILIEPGRSLVGDSGVLETEVILISRKAKSDRKRWVYLDVGTYGGMSEVLGESIKYRFMCPNERTGVLAPVVIAGPTCDSADILYEKSAYYLPSDLAIGDRVTLLACGAYTVSCCSTSFNGFTPITNHCI